MINKCDNCVMENCCEEFTEIGCADIKAYGDAIKAKVRAEVFQEIASAYMLLTEKQVDEIRADAIDKFIAKVDYAEGFIIIPEAEYGEYEPTVLTLRRIADKWKEQKE